ncbi:ATP-binding protein [Flindersiella endophytica]
MTEAGLAYLLGRVGVVRRQVAALVADRRSTDPEPDDPYRGLYVSDDQVDRLLASAVAALAPPVTLDDETLALLRRVEADADAAPEPPRLRRLRKGFGLSDLDVQLLLVALAPDLDAGFERLYGYLNDDVTRRRPTIGLALELCGESTVSPGRARLGPNGPLVTGGLVLVEEPERPFLTRSLRVPDRVTAHLLDDDRPDPAVAHLVTDDDDAALTAAEPLDVDTDVVPGLANALRAGAEQFYLRDRPGGAAMAAAFGGLSQAGFTILGVDLGRLGTGEDAAYAARLLAREARLRGAGLVAGPVEALSDRGAADVRAFADLPVPVLLIGSGTWDPHWSSTPPVLVDVPVQRPADRARLWRSYLAEQAPDDLDHTTVVSQYALSAGQVRKAAQAARQQSLLDGGVVTAAHLRAGARAQNAGGLERLARRIEPGVGWKDLVLPPLVLEGLQELTARARHREQVLRDWRMRPGGGRGVGVTALFAGDSGTGKTMSAEVIAAELGLDLYAVDLATVVDKYVGETEKNLERIFTEATGVNGVLLFDEADAIFGKRSEVRDAHDRYANVETAYLLQRMESFDGLAILATNLRANVDDAFTRRLDVIIDFPLPDEDHRKLLWETCLGSILPRAGNLDLDFCAQSFELAGGNIRSIAVTAAYLAAEREVAVGMAELVAAVAREYRKLGRLCLPSEFGAYYDLVRELQ